MVCTTALALVHRVVPGSEDVVRQRAVFSVGAIGAEKSLALPCGQHALHDRGAIRGERARAAVHGAVHRLGATQVVEGEDEAHVQHPRDQ